MGPAVLRPVRAASRRSVHLPFDHRAGKSALLPARRFPSDPHDTILEQNDVAVLMRSDSLAHIADARKTLFDDLPYFTVTSIRRGFAGGGFAGKQSLPKKMAMAAGCPRRRPHSRDVRAVPRLHVDAEGGPRPAADREPRDARLRRSARRLLPRRHAHAPLAPRRGPRGVVPQLRLTTSACSRRSGPGLTDVKQGTQTVPQGPKDVATQAETAKAIRARPGASGTARRSRRARGCCRTSSGPTARMYPKGTAIPQRADFNTLDNPFAWTRDPRDATA